VYANRQTGYALALIFALRPNFSAFALQALAFDHQRGRSNKSSMNNKMSSHMRSIRGQKEQEYI